MFFWFLLSIFFFNQLDLFDFKYSKNSIMKYYSLQIFIACDGKAGFSAPLL